MSESYFVNISCFCEKFVRFSASDSTADESASSASEDDKSTSFSSSFVGTLGLARFFDVDAEEEEDDEEDDDDDVDDVLASLSLSPGAAAAVDLSDSASDSFFRFFGSMIRPYVLFFF